MAGERSRQPDAESESPQGEIELLQRELEAGRLSLVELLEALGPDPDGARVQALGRLASRLRSRRRASARPVPGVPDKDPGSPTRDPLTGLPNRRAFRAQLDTALHYAERHGEQVAVIHVLLEGLPGPEAGGRGSASEGALLTLADRMAAVARRSDRLARLGATEFALLLQGRELDYAPARIAERLLEDLGRACLVDGEDCSPRTWIGIAVHPRDGAETASLMRQAAEAAESARDEGRERYRFCGQAMTHAEARGLAIADHLRFALEREQLEVHYQPRVDGRSGRILGAEALLRWHDPELGDVSPAEFVPIAERLDLMDEIGAWVMQQACSAHGAWSEAGFPELCVAVNVSAHQVESASLRDAVVHGILESGLAPERLEIELTESVLVDNERHAAQLLREFADLGVSLALDDFGTGYSSLGYLRQFPVSTLKIDTSFVREIRDGKPFPAFVEALLALGRSLELAVVAEGVETLFQRDALLERGCSEMQGFLFSRPLPPRDFLARLAAGGAFEAR